MAIGPIEMPSMKEIQGMDEFGRHYDAGVGGRELPCPRLLDNRLQ